MATKTANIGLHVTPDSDVEKRVADWRHDLDGDGEDSNMMIIDKTFGERATLVDGVVPVGELPVNLVTYCDAATGAILGSELLLFEATQVPVSAWVLSSVYKMQGFPWCATVALNKITAVYRPSLTLTMIDATGGNFAPIADSYNGGIHIYAKEKPTEVMTIPSIICIREGA